MQAGRLLIRKTLCEMFDVDNALITLGRTEKGRPYWINRQFTGSRYEGDSCVSFNVSHQGNYAVLAAEKQAVVGIDIMKIVYPS